MQGIDLDALIHDHLSKEQKTRKKREVGRFWVSDFGKCKRQIYYSFTNPKEYSGETRRIFSIGNLIHEHIQHLLKEREGDIFSEVWNEKYTTITDTVTDLIITGKVDSVVTPVGSVPVALEFKTENENSFHRRKSIPYHHKCQLMLYLRSQRIPFGYLVYINKSDMQFNVMKLDYDEQLFQRIMRDARDIYYHLKQSSLPPANPKMPWECKYCIYKSDCEKNLNVALHKRLFPKKENGDY